MDHNLRDIGESIARHREELSMSQSELARRLRTSQSAIARMEKGEQNMSASMLAKLSNIFKKDIITLSGDEIDFEIEGGHTLSGETIVKTSKNSAVALLCASLLNKGTTTLKKMPRIEEVNRIVEVLESIGVSIKKNNDNDFIITPPARLSLKKMNMDAAVKTRSVIMLLGPLIHLFSSFSLPHPGGCKLGARTIRAHEYALEDMGVTITSLNGSYTIQSKFLKPATIVMYESGDTATINALFTAAKISGKTIIKYASANYQVQDVCFFLQKLGVKVSGIGSTTLIVDGIGSINLPITFYPSEDPIEAMLFISLAIATQSSITIRRCPIEFLDLELLKLEKMGFRYTRSPVYLANNRHTQLVDITTRPSKLIALDEKIYARPYPGLNIDNLPFFVPIATQAEGQTLIHDWVYENRAIYYTELKHMGADLILADPHRLYITGPTKLKPVEMLCPPALRPAVIIMIAMLTAPGRSILRNVYSINRGYEDISSRLTALGAHIRMLRQF